MASKPCGSALEMAAVTFLTFCIVPFTDSVSRLIANSSDLRWKPVVKQVKGHLLLVWSPKAHYHAHLVLCTK